jgi:hypothetical protein
MNQREAFMWRRQFSFDQMSKCRRIDSARGWLDSETQQMAGFARCQLQDTEDRFEVSSTHSIKWENTQVEFDVRIRPLFVEYAARIYTQALKDVYAYYPDFARHLVTDGPLVGERRLVFPDHLDEAAAYWLQTRFWELAEHGDIAIGESCSMNLREKVSPETWHAPGELVLVLDKPLIDRATQDEAIAIFRDGKPYPLDEHPRKCDRQLAASLLAELSLPELVLLNWPQVKKPLSEVDRQLFEALEAFDVAAIQVALAAGANPNAISPDGRGTALTQVVTYKRADRVSLNNERDYACAVKEHPGPSPEEIIRVIDLLVGSGAAVNWAPPDERAPLSEACLNGTAEVVEHLLSLGADPSLRCYSDKHPMDWGDAWDDAYFRRDPIVDNDEPSLWNALAAKWPEPYGNVRVSKNTDKS